jgi:hypothetical protein
MSSRYAPAAARPVSAKLILCNEGALANLLSSLRHENEVYMKKTLTALAVLAALAGPAAASPGSIARSAAANTQDGLFHRTGGKNSIAKQCERNADYQKLTGLSRQAHIENCLKTMNTFSDKKKGVGQP